MAPKKNTGKPKQSKAPAAPTQDVRLAWDNIEEVMAHFDLTQSEATSALTDILGPQPEDRDKPSNSSPM